MPVAGVVTVRGINPREGIHGAPRIARITRIPEERVFGNRRKRWVIWLARTIGEYLRGKSIKITTNSIAHFFSSAIDNYIFFIRITFWIYGVNSLEGFLAVAETFIIFIFLHPKAS